MNIRRDCIHYHCEHEMGASIDCCSLKGLGKCPCSEDCAEYANRAEVYKMGLEAIKSKHTKHMIDERSTIKPEPHWIPCSERLPKKNGFYLCTTKDCITILEFIAGNPHYHEESSFVSDVLGKCNSYVVAWMPLPEPYREGE